MQNPHILMVTSYEGHDHLWILVSMEILESTPMGYLGGGGQYNFPLAPVSKECPYQFLVLYCHFGTDFFLKLILKIFIMLQFIF